MNIKHNPPMKQKWIDAFMDTAERFAQLSTAKRLQVGSVVVKDNRIISIGYNGTPAGWDNNCEDKVYDSGAGGWLDPEEFLEKYPYEEYHGEFQDYKVRYGLKTKREVIHAEANAISKLARSIESGLGSTMFVTHAPCIDCAKLIYGAGVEKVYYRDTYRETTGVDFLAKCGITVEQV